MPKPSTTQLVDSYGRKLQKAIAHLEYSYNKVQTLPTAAAQMDEEILETWESFTARFSRTVDLFLTKYVRARVFREDPGFSGTLRDFVDFAEKISLLDSADLWMELRGFRNLISHEYEEDELESNLIDMRALAPKVIAIKAAL